MSHCAICKKGILNPVMVEYHRQIEERLFKAEIAAHICSECKELYYDGPILERFELQAALELLKMGEKRGSAVRFIRKSLGFLAKDLAELLGTTAETVSRWENGKQQVDYKTRALLASMVVDALEGQHTTLDTLKMLQEPISSEKEVVLSPVAA